MFVSIVAGPATRAFCQELPPTLARERLEVFEPAAGSEPEEIIRRLKAMAGEKALDHLLIVCEPERPVMAYASLFAEAGRLPQELGRVAFAIKASALLDHHSMSCFIAEQIEFAGDLFLEADSNNEQFHLAESMARILNPAAKVLRLEEANVAAWCCGSGTPFDFETAWNGGGWRKLIDGDLTIARADSRITAFGYGARRPFHPDRFWNLLRKDLGGVFRAKGFFWLATRMNEVGGLNLAGSELHCAAAGNWWAARDEHIRESEMPERTRKEWMEPFGDRRQSFAVIALDAEENRLRTQLDACLLTESEMRSGSDGWKNLTDPFPSWSSHSHHHHDHEHECDHHHGSEEHDCCHH